MEKRLLAVGIFVLGLSAGASAAPQGTKGRGADSPVLTEGLYSAKVKALVCDGCRPFVEKALLGVPGVSSISVDKATSRVQFEVKQGSSVERAALQEALKSPAAQMGMGADYTLSDFQTVIPEKPKASASAQDVLPPGHYVAKIGAMVCRGCRPLIERTMRQVPGVGSVQVDERNSVVDFTAAPKKTLVFSDLQKALDAAAETMGRGADYRLLGVKKMQE